MSKDIRYEMGNMGEQIVTELFPLAKRSEDWYDRQKDGTIGSVTYEVKTQTLIQKDQSFWIESNQWNKLDNADVVFFVQVPWEKTDPINVYIATHHTKNYDIIYHKGEKKRAYMLTKCLLVGTINDSRTQKLWEYSLQISPYKRKVLMNV